MRQPNPIDERSNDLSPPSGVGGGIRARFVSRVRTGRVRVAVYLLPVALVVLYLAVDLLGGGCSGDLLDNAEYACDTGGEAMWVIFFLGLVFGVVVAATLLADLARHLFRGSGRGPG
jgi:hypothetical protein